MSIKDNAAARAAFDTVLGALDRLQADRITVIGVFYGGSKPVVIVDRKPAFVRGGLKQRQVVGAQVQRTYAAPFHGVQLQWLVVTPIVREVGHA